MLRVTVELVPFGMEALTRTLSEVCIANVGGDSDVADYKFAGYEVGYDKKIAEFAGEIKGFSRAEGVLRLVESVLAAEDDSEFADEIYAILLRKTRLVSEDEEASTEEG